MVATLDWIEPQLALNEKLLSGVLKLLVLPLVVANDEGDAARVASDAGDAARVANGEGAAGSGAGAACAACARAGSSVHNVLSLIVSSVSRLARTVPNWNAQNLQSL